LSSTATLQAYPDSEAILKNELLILGGGCAGLSLARRLSALGTRCPQTLILETRRTYTDDRTWCFWSEPAAQLTHLVSHRWTQISVAAKGELATVDCASFPYAMIPSAAFYEDSLALIAAASQLKLELGASVLTEPQKVGNEWHVETSAGTRSGKIVIDTRPPTRRQALLWQSFIGHEIESATPIFQPEIAELMHFATGHDGQILFFYLLPFSPNRALLEVTVFAAEPLGPEDLQPEMQAFLARRLPTTKYLIRRSEHGALPMGTPHRPIQPDPSHLTVGLFSGGARPSSGYAFQRIQRWAAECANALGKGLQPLPHRRDPLPLRAMDRLFLYVLRRCPEIGPELFLALFQKVDIARLVRFMSDQATLADCTAVVSALPSGPFLREILPALKSSFLR
jgi:lycopene beta-cyclase